MRPGTGKITRMLRWLAALTTALVLTGFAVLLLTGEYENEGPVVASVTSTHGLHEGDLFVLAGWLVAMAALAVLVLLPRSREVLGPLPERRRLSRRRPASTLPPSDPTSTFRSPASQ